jgi:hypothetical protein
MNKMLTMFIDRLVERLAVLVTRLIGSRVEGLHAEFQADQQSQLEDLARRYESEDKSAIAATLRDRAAKLSSPNAASEAVEILRLVTDPSAQSSDPGTGSNEFRSLPNFSKTPRAASKSRRNSSTSTPAQDRESQQ